MANWQDIGGYTGAGLGIAGLAGSLLGEQPSGFNQGISKMEDYLRRLQGKYGEFETRTFNPLTDPGMRAVRGQMQSALAQQQAQLNRTLAQRGMSSTGLAGASQRETGLDYARQLGTQTAQRQQSFEQWRDQMMMGLLGQMGTSTAQLAQLYGKRDEMEMEGSPWTAMAGLGGQLLGSVIGG